MACRGLGCRLTLDLCLAGCLEAFDRTTLHRSDRRIRHSRPPRVVCNDDADQGFDSTRHVFCTGADLSSDTGFVRHCLPVASHGPWVRGQQIRVYRLMLLVDPRLAADPQGALQVPGDRLVGLKARASCVCLDEDDGDREAGGDRRSSDQDQDPGM